MLGKVELGMYRGSESERGLRTGMSADRGGGGRERSSERDRKLAQAGMELQVSASRAERRRKSLQFLDQKPAKEEGGRGGKSRVDMKGKRSDKAMEEFNTLLSALSLLNDDTQLHLVYSLAIEAVTTEEDLKLLAEALHQRWLSDPSFPPTAAKLALFFADLELDDLKFGSMMFTIVMNDWRDRVETRKVSRAIFANSVHFTFQFYFAFRHRGPVFKSLIEPLFEYLHILVDKDAGDGELLLLQRLFCTFGADIAALNFRETQDILIRVRHKIIDGELKARVRGKLLEVIDLSYAQFEFSALTEEQQDFYLRYHVRSGSEPLTSESESGTLPRRRLTPKPTSHHRQSIIF